MLACVARESAWLSKKANFFEVVAKMEALVVSLDPHLKSLTRVWVYQQVSVEQERSDSHLIAS